MVAKVYRRFQPGTEERERWERIAEASDAEKWPVKVPWRVPHLRNNLRHYK